MAEGKEIYMSEAEKKRRLDYKRNRRKWIIVQAVALALVAVIALSSFIVYNQLNKTYYIHYTEDGSVDYKVHVTENEFYEEEWLEKDKAYISSLMDNIFADFTYKLHMDASKVNFDYSYEINSQVIVTDNDSGKTIYAKTENLVPTTTLTSDGKSSLELSEEVYVDYATYNNRVKDLVKTYQLRDYSAKLLVTMDVDVISKCKDFEQNGENSYSITMNVPLDKETVNITTSTTVPASDSKVLACPSSILDPNVFKWIAIIFAVIAILGLGGCIAFIYLTRNEDINYSIKVKRLLSAYRSFIQQINNEFDSEGYQIIMVKTFNEMLGIRDTIQSPILMHENEDRTCTRFLIPTNTKILYVFEIKVENYDQLYAEAEPEEPVILEENVDEEELSEAMAEPDVELAEVDFVEDNDPEEESGVEVIGVVWPEKAHKNKVYKYDPNGEQLSDGDIVLVPSRDVARNKDIIRKAAVAHGNHKVPPEMLHHPLKKIIGVVKRKAEQMLTDAEPDNKDNK